MKKYFIILISLLATCCWSCQDETGEFIKQLHTNSQLSKGAKACLSVAKDTAVAHICIAGGMNSYSLSFPNSGSYRALRDTLSELGQTELLDTLYARINRACEMMGDDVTTTFNSIIDDLTFSNPYDLVYGSNDTLTNYLRLYKESELQNSLTNALNTQLAATQASTTWNEIIILYNANSSVPLSIDLNAFILNGFLDAIFSEIAKEETLIRTDAAHRVTSTLKDIFGAIGENETE